MDELAELIGCRPSMPKLFLRDPSLAVRCFFGPCIPAQYRLTGPNQWQGAATAIRRSLWNNVIATKTRVVEKVASGSYRRTNNAIVISIMFGLMILLVWFAVLTV